MRFVHPGSAVIEVTKPEYKLQLYNEENFPMQRITQDEFNELVDLGLAVLAAKNAAKDAELDRQLRRPTSTPFATVTKEEKELKEDADKVVQPDSMVIAENEVATAKEKFFAAFKIVLLKDPALPFLTMDGDSIKRYAEAILANKTHFGPGLDYFLATYIKYYVKTTLPYQRPASFENLRDELIKTCNTYIADHVVPTIPLPFFDKITSNQHTNIAKNLVAMLSSIDSAMAGRLARNEDDKPTIKLTLLHMCIKALEYYLADTNSKKLNELFEKFKENHLQYARALPTSGAGFDAEVKRIAENYFPPVFSHDEASVEVRKKAAKNNVMVLIMAIIKDRSPEAKVVVSGHF
jgi:hypothetical protein